ncbi:MAG: translation initiation factor IF-2, partial [Gammaproteobacteria bacterium]
RGAQVTDIVVLVVAADDGVMPQTIEAIQHARAANVPIVVAINKIDREDADPDRVRNELAQQNLIPEEWGGDTLFVSVSAHTGQGIEDLLDAILLQAEILDLKAPDDGPASGVVIEGSLERGRGAVATVLVKQGQLKVGDILLAGQEYGRIRAMFDEKGAQVKSAGPSIPVVVLGLSGVPQAGDDVIVVPDERKAREVAELRRGRERDVKLAQQQAAKLDDIFTQMRETGTASLTVLIKADVQGSAEALRDALQKLSTEDAKVTVIGANVGGITESDVQLAATSGAIIIGFNVRADAGARNAIKETGVDVRYYSVIYQAIDDIKAALSGMLAPEIREQIVGLAEVREVFRSPKFGNIAGCMVVDGYVRKNNPIRVLRNNVVIFEGQLESLRRFKDDVTEVRAGTECGIGVRNYNDVKVGDQIECYERTEVARTL